jgi:hypothetical protein
MERLRSKNGWESCVFGAFLKNLSNSGRRAFHRGTVAADQGIPPVQYLHMSTDHHIRSVISLLLYRDTRKPTANHRKETPDKSETEYEDAL